MAKLTSDIQDLRKKDVKALESLVLEIRENQFKNRMKHKTCLLYTSPSPRDATLSRMPSSA